MAIHTRVRAPGHVATWLTFCLALAANTVGAAWRTVDLTPAVPAPAGLGGRPWNQFPTGEVVLAGIPFRIERRIELTGLAAARNREFAPPVVSLPVGAAAARFHLLHGALHGQKDGIPTASVVAVYADGSSSTQRLAYGVQVRNFAVRDDEPAGVLDPSSALAWESTNSYRRVRLYQTSWENPQPAKVVERVEFRSLFGPATPVVLGLTLDPQPAPGRVDRLRSRKAVGRARALPDDAYTRVFVARVEDPQGQPLTNAAVTLTVTDDAGSFPFGDVLTDAAGGVRFWYPVQQARELVLRIRAPGYIGETMQFPLTRSVAEGRSQVARLRPGATGGGRVVNDVSQPVTGAVVTVYQSRPTSATVYTETVVDQAVTDAAGTWRSQSLAPDARDLRFLVTHPEHHGGTWFQDPGTKPDTNLVRRVASPELFASRAEFRLVPLIRLAGTVTDAAGLAVTNARVRCRIPAVDPDQRGVDQTLRVDAAGRFQLLLEERGLVQLGVWSPDFAPLYREAAVGPGSPPLSLVLGPGDPVHLEVRDQRQRALTNVEVSLQSWNGQRMISWETTTDARGEAVWSQAPVGVLNFSVRANGYNYGYVRLAAPDTNRVAVILTNVTRVAGSVVDERNGFPIENFEVIRGHRLRADGPFRWWRSSGIRGRRGGFTLGWGETDPGEKRILIEAPGYLPVTLGPFDPPGAFTNQMVELNPGFGLRGRLLSPSGVPAAKAQMALLGPDEEIPLEYGSLSRRSDLTGFDQTTADGQFNFPPREGPLTLVATHPSGFLQVPMTAINRTQELVLQPWGRIRGTVRTGAVARTPWVIVYPPPHRDPGPGRTLPALSMLLRASVDYRGNFTFDRVPPGEWCLGLAPRLRESPSDPLPASHGVVIDVRPGVTNVVAVGEPGRSLVGRMVVNGDAGDVMWSRGRFELSLILTGAPPANLGPTQALAFWNSPAGRELARRERTYALVFDRTGTVFRADAVPAGRYRLTLAPVDPTWERSSRDDSGPTFLGQFSQEITVVPGAGPQDLGTFNVSTRPVLRVDEAAPDFAVTNLDGRVVSLASLRGHPVLLDFWDSTAAERNYDVDVLRSLVPGDPTNRLVVISVNCDRNARAAAAYFATTRAGWEPVLLGGWGGLPAKFGIDSTAAILIDADGAVATRPTRLQNLSSTLRRLGTKPVATRGK